jgi:hypothetical protein
MPEAENAWSITAPQPNRTQSVAQARHQAITIRHIAE